jgi:hypothetical protein
LDIILGGLQKWSGCCEENTLPLPGFEPRRPVRSYTD